MIFVFGLGREATCTYFYCNIFGSIRTALCLISGAEASNDVSFNFKHFVFGGHWALGCGPANARPSTT